LDKIWSKYSLKPFEPATFALVRRTGHVTDGPWVGRRTPRAGGQSGHPGRLYTTLEWWLSRGANHRRSSRRTRYERWFFP